MKWAQRKPYEGVQSAVPAYFLHDLSPYIVRFPNGMGYRWTGSAYLTGYEYNPNGAPITYDPADIVHFRDGMDPDNTRKGLSPLASLLREIFTDDEAVAMTASTPGFCTRPAPGAGSTWTCPKSR